MEGFKEHPHLENAVLMDCLKLFGPMTYRGERPTYGPWSNQRKVRTQKLSYLGCPISTHMRNGWNPKILDGGTFRLERPTVASRDSVVI